MLDHSPTVQGTKGRRYDRLAPDTLDLAERMALAIHALTNVWTPEAKWALNFIVDFSHRPAILYPSGPIDAYLNIPPKFLEALTLCRLASGSTANAEVDRAVLQAQLEQLGPDSLTYCPADTLPEFKEQRPYAEVWSEGRRLIALSMFTQVDNDPRWAALARRKVDHMLSLTREKEGCRFLWDRRYYPNHRVPDDAQEPVSAVKDSVIPNVGRMLYSVGVLGHGSGLFYRVTGHEPALELSRGLARWALARAFTNDDGRFPLGHFHHSLYALMAVCEYACAANDRAVLERVDACYRWARALGDPLIGYYTEHMPGTTVYLGTSYGILDDFLKPTGIPRRAREENMAFMGNQGNTVETCEVADMVWLALYLTRAGMGDYWDDIDRWTRNVFSEAQMREASVIEHLPHGLLTDKPSDAPHQDTNNVAARSVGSFWGWLRPNDGLCVFRTSQGPKLYHHSIMHCCTGNGARTLYLVWDSIVTKAPDEVRVNLLLNRASPWLDVDSYLPVEGKVVLHIKDAPKVAVRLPEWCEPQQVRVQVGGETRRPVIEGQWLRLGYLQPGDDVTLAFPVPERVEHRVIGEMLYKLTMRGSNVVAIDPKGQAYPLYENQLTGKLVKKSHFISNVQNIIW